MTIGQCIRMHTTGGPDVLSLEPLELSPPGAGKVQIKVEAIGLNFIDTYQRTGLYPVKLPFIPGSEAAGTIESVGEGVTDFSIGDRVAVLGGAAYATHIHARADQLMALPDSLSFADAAAVLLKGMTAWMLLFEIRPVRPGDTALVWAPVGGVGSLVVPWARSLGAQVIGVTSSAQKADKARRLGANHVVLRSGDVAAEVRTLTGGRGVDISFDSVGKSSAEASLNSLAPRGWWISYGNASGPADPVAPATLSQKGSLIMTRPGMFHFTSTKSDLARAHAALLGALSVGTIKAEIGQTFALGDAGEAHRAIESGTTTGSTVLLP